MAQMTEYYRYLRVMWKLKGGSGAYVDIWQHIKDGQVVGYLDDTGNVPFELPEKYECAPLSTDCFFAPHVLKDPAIQELAVDMEEYMAAVNAGTTEQFMIDWAQKNNPELFQKLIEEKIARDKTATPVTPAVPAIQG